MSLFNEEKKLAEPYAEGEDVHVYKSPRGQMGTHEDTVYCMYNKVSDCRSDQKLHLQIDLCQSLQN